MTIQYLSQLTQLYDTLTFMWRFRKAESNLPPATLQDFRYALDDVKKIIDELCEELNVKPSHVRKYFADLPPDFGVPESLIGQSFECTVIEPDAELSDSFFKKLKQNRPQVISERKRLSSVIDGMRNPKKPLTSTEISLLFAEQIFKDSSQFSPLEKILLFQEVSDEIFSYGPLSPFIRSFQDLQITDTGAFTAGNRQLNIVFDNDLHRDETLATLKYALEVTTSDGTVKYSNPGSWTITAPSHIAIEIDKPKTRLEKLGFSEKLIVVNSDQLSPLQKAVDWITRRLANKLTK